MCLVEHRMGVTKGQRREELDKEHIDSGYKVA